ncbi:hypothetical protein [Kitasatospora phosalacinea]|uniref:Uncharacterized protein n=1 Tax=Kitasatospora phosalacinea TaxID=2065 RepID=A0A9W6PPJ4_9ACTN|nr:hypothetical protein [Kitasatospora phosalacinea]GLW58561.1 hypothetical protein Kpho01_65720 [Kitasatospora phosalacinea]
MPTAPPPSELTRTINTIQRGMFAAVLVVIAATAISALRDQLLITYPLLAVVAGLLWLQSVVVLHLPKAIKQATEQHGGPPLLPSPGSRR